MWGGRGEEPGGMEEQEQGEKRRKKRRRRRGDKTKKITANRDERYEGGV